jgi:hypothetical protein
MSRSPGRMGGERSLVPFHERVVTACHMKQATNALSSAWPRGPGVFAGEEIQQRPYRG